VGGGGGGGGHYGDILYSMPSAAYCHVTHYLNGHNDTLPTDRDANDKNTSLLEERGRVSWVIIH